ncbi:hypothetical protein KQI82_03495 [Oscillibacter sp. MSJ-2]|uniref:DUF4367 domain-containing protein n=1 Tax=Dysosmobacter acutus TaxID=2841504 RepID=A0ABS6F9N4_9FIRM|nr:hypothetical protein [Dysosmobacter acutus]MBU5626004.1 hypothetical protein [Dysosmobacter acutus]
MDRTDLAEAMGFLSSAHIAEAASYEKKPRAFRMAALAACLLLLAAAVFGGGKLPFQTAASSSAGSATAEAVYGFVLNDRLYLPITFEQRKEFGLVPEDAVGLAEEHRFPPTEADLGQRIGYAGQSDDPALVGAAVYRWASLPDNDRICVAEIAQGRYGYFVFAWRTDVSESGASSTEIFDAYGISPDSVQSIEVTTGGDLPVIVLSIKEDISFLLDLFSGREDMGAEAHEQRFADLWYETYGTREVYLNGDSMHYDGLDKNDWTIYDRAHKLWNGHQRQLLLHLKNGDQLYLLYNPAVRSLSIHNSFFDLSLEECAELNSLLAVER